MAVTSTGLVNAGRGVQVNGPVNGTSGNPLLFSFNVGGNAANKGLVVQGAAGQTGDLTQWQNSAGSVLSYIAASGVAVLQFTAVGGARELVLGAADSAGAGFRTVRVAN